MNRKTIGFAIMLLSLIFLIGFNIIGWRYVGDLALMWPMVWMLTAIVGFVLVVWEKKKENKDTEDK